ncbi:MULTISPECIES: helix-turn-helix domain-containing protein [Gracilibacillus]|uniref:helix-turn-helix domain-containing protein n=1 Tax=Gracilibacillus TaxID=74385 RepID=UPI0008243722|nr:MULTISPECIES: AraC family transcriptional regulator [Gracilibacillus]
MIQVEGIYHDIAPHWHTGKARGLYTIVFVTEGEVHYIINDEQIILTAGDFLWIPDDVYRSWKSAPSINHTKYTLLCEIEQEELPFPQKGQFFSYRPRNMAYYEQRLSFLYVQWLGKRAYYQQLSQQLIRELLFFIAQERFEQNASPAKEVVVRKMQNHLLYHFRSHVTIEELSELVDVTPNYVTVLFKEVMGMTPIQYLHQTRINAAHNLLTTTNMSVKEVAEYLGYCDQSYFNRMFKKWMGIAPSHARRSTHPKT